MDKIIYQSYLIKASPEKAFEMFTSNKHLEKWLTGLADIEPEVGGKYELFWNPSDKENDSTIGCKILALTPNRFLSFEWKGPRQFKHFMNEIRPLTNVAISFIPIEGGTEIHLSHTGWGNTSEWEEARKYFDMAWKMALSELEKYIDGEETEICCE